jgi:hypothetical protein
LLSTARGSCFLSRHSNILLFIACRSTGARFPFVGRCDFEACAPYMWSSIWSESMSALLRSVRASVIVFGTFSADSTPFRRCILCRKGNRSAGSGLLSYPPAETVYLARAICRRDYFITALCGGGTPLRG